MPPRAATSGVPQAANTSWPWCEWPGAAGAEAARRAAEVVGAAHREHVVVDRDRLVRPGGRRRGRWPRRRRRARQHERVLAHRAARGPCTRRSSSTRLSAPGATAGLVPALHDGAVGDADEVDLQVHRAAAEHAVGEHRPLRRRRRRACAASTRRPRPARAPRRAGRCRAAAAGPRPAGRPSAASAGPRGRSARRGRCARPAARRSSARPRSRGEAGAVTSSAGRARRRRRAVPRGRGCGPRRAGSRPARRGGCRRTVRPGSLTQRTSSSTGAGPLGGRRLRARGGGRHAGAAAAGERRGRAAGTEQRAGAGKPDTQMRTRRHRCVPARAGQRPAPSRF